VPPDEATSELREPEETHVTAASPIDQVPVTVPEASWDDEERRRRLRPWAIGGAVVVALVTGSVALSYTSLFGARTVEVEGEEQLGPRQVMRLAQVTMGTNVLHLDEAKAAARLEDEPWILDATVRTSLPGTISISIRERTPVLVLQSGSVRRLAAADGTVLGRAPKTAAFPVVTVPEGLRLGPGQVAAAADVVTAMVPVVRARVDSLSIAGDGEVAMVVDGGVDVVYGSASDAVVKAQALRAILDWAEQEERGLLSIDLSVPAAPTARFVGSLQPTTVPDPSADVPPSTQGGDGDDGGSSEEPSPSP
jgi:cell division protein FtsQ